jgi:protein-S-isoprenylcysteine O-methyltransferase Ste14
MGFLCWIAVFAWMIDPDWIAWSSMPVPRSARWIGAGLFVAGCGLLAWTFRSLDLNLTDTVVTRRAHTLVVHGPYRWIRHPLYDAVLLITVGFALAAATWFVLATGLAVFGLLALRTRIEERKLVERFGEDYRQYMRRTGRYLPRGGSG